MIEFTISYQHKLLGQTFTLICSEDVLHCLVSHFSVLVFILWTCIQHNTNNVAQHFLQLLTKFCIHNVYLFFVCECENYYIVKEITFFCVTFSIKPRTPDFEGLEHFPPSVWMMSTPSCSSISASLTCLFFRY